MSTHTGLKKLTAAASIIGIALIAFCVSGLHAEASRGVSVPAAVPATQSQESVATTSGGLFGSGSAGSGIEAPPLPPELIVPVVTSETADQILHETLDPLHVDWVYDCVGMGGAWGIVDWNPVWIFNHYIIQSNPKICVRSDLPPEHAKWIALHEYGHVLQAQVAAAQTPFLIYSQLEARVSRLFDASVNNLQPDTWDPHLEIISDCIAKQLNGGTWEHVTGYYTHDCSGARGAAAQAIIDGNLP